MEEHHIYSDNNISVSSAKITILNGGTTFYPKNISTVIKTVEVQTNGCLRAILIFLGAGSSMLGCLSFIIIAGLFVNNGIMAGWIGIGVTLLVLILPFVAFFWFRTKIYGVKVLTTGGEATIISSKDESYIEMLIAHINESVRIAQE